VNEKDDVINWLVLVANTAFRMFAFTLWLKQKSVGLRSVDVLTT